MITNYKAEQGLDTSYMRARQVWDGRLGTANAQASHWRLIAFGLLVIVAILCAGLTYVGSQSKIIPYVVEVGGNGQIGAVNRATEKSYIPTQEVTKYAIRNFIQSVRSLPSDPVVARSNLENSYNYLTQRGASILNGIFTQNNPVAEFGKKTRSLHVDTVLPISNNTFQAEWSEIEYDTAGIRTNIQVLHGAFTVVYQEPPTEEAVRKNPLGVYIDNFSWSVSMK